MFVHPTPRIPEVPLYAINNEELVKKTSYICQDTGALLEGVSTKYYQPPKDKASRKVCAGLGWAEEGHRWAGLANLRFFWQTTPQV